jgi:hypothetical protein
MATATEVGLGCSSRGKRVAIACQDLMAHGEASEGEL